MDFLRNRMFRQSLLVRPNVQHSVTHAGELAGSSRGQFRGDRRLAGRP